MPNSLGQCVLGQLNWCEEMWATPAPPLRLREVTLEHVKLGTILAVQAQVSQNALEVLLTVADELVALRIN